MLQRMPTETTWQHIEARQSLITELCYGEINIQKMRELYMRLPYGTPNFGGQLFH